MKAFILILALITPALADDCQSSISWRRLVIGGEMQDNTWTKDNPGIYSAKLKANKNCTSPKKVGLSRAEYEQKLHNDREEYVTRKKEESDFYENRKEQRDRDKILKALSKPGNGYGDKNHTHIGSKGKPNVTKHSSNKKDSKGKKEKSGKGLPRVSKQESGKDTPRSNSHAGVKGNSKS